MNNQLSEKWMTPIIVIMVFVFSVSGCGNQVSSIETSIGTLTVAEAEIVETLPGSGERAMPGYQILLVWFEGDIEGGDLFEASEGVYVTGDDKSQTDRFMAGTVQQRLCVGFTPPSTTKTFTLSWPDNPPIKLVLTK